MLLCNLNVEEYGINPVPAVVEEESMETEDDKYLSKHKCNSIFKLYLFTDKDDFQFVWEKAGVLSGHWDSIGIMLGLSSNKLDEIEAESKTARGCLRKVFDCWLKRDYDYKSHGVPTLRMLFNCIKSESGGANPALADKIEKEYSASLANNSEELQLRSSSPVDTSSSKGIVKHFAAKLYL